MKKLIDDLTTMPGGAFHDFLRWVPDEILYQLIREDRSENLLRRLERELSAKAFARLMTDASESRSAVIPLRTGKATTKTGAPVKTRKAA